MQKLREMKGLGPASEKQLKAVGIETPAQLAELGAVHAFLRLKQHAATPPSLNFLYAMVGALDGDRPGGERATADGVGGLRGATQTA